MMKIYVITMMNNHKSVQASKRCRESAEKFGYKVDIFPAITPDDDPNKMFEKENLPIDKFKVDSRFSKTEPCMCCFLSHREIWKESVKTKQKILILEHDAVFKEKLPQEIYFHGLVNFGKPSFGRYNIPSEGVILQRGIFSLFSKSGGYLPGAHAYMISPVGAEKLLKHAEKYPAPTDLFLNNKDFPWLQEYYPWPIEADDKFTTIQKVEGCIAKHNYNEDYKIL